MGFFRTALNEFGKKTGKALGNKLYGAYADDRRVGVNRGKLKGQSDGLKITSSHNQQISAAAPIAQPAVMPTETAAKVSDNVSATQVSENKSEKNQELFDTILNIELQPNNKDELIKSLTQLSVYLELQAKDNSDDDHFVVAKSKYDTALALLQVTDPNNPMTNYFLQKKTDWKKAKKKNNLEILIIVAVCVLLFAGIFIYLHVTGELYEESPLEKLLKK